MTGRPPPSIEPEGKLLPFRRPEDSAGELSAESLVQLCADGDQAALGLLFDRFHLRLHRFLSRFVGADSPDLEDLVQTTFLEVLRAAPRFRRQSSVQTWIFAIAVNVVRHHRRSEVRRRALFDALLEPGRQDGGAPSPEEHTAQRLLLGRLAEAVAALPHELRTAFVMCDLEDLPGLEVAEALGWRPGTLWRRLHEARKLLRQVLSQTQVQTKAKAKANGGEGS